VIEKFRDLREPAERYVRVATFNHAQERLRDAASFGNITNREATLETQPLQHLANVWMP
jgi:cell fate (sporulation/competence/biofilm development) regulator YlbF (YheA/YmcA/DUF963 family)